MQTLQPWPGNYCVYEHNLISGFSHLHCFQHTSVACQCWLSSTVWIPFHHVSEWCHTFVKGGFSLPCVCHVYHSQPLNAVLRSFHANVFYLTLNCGVCLTRSLLFSLVYNQGRTRFKASPFRLLFYFLHPAGSVQMAFGRRRCKFTMDAFSKNGTKWQTCDLKTCFDHITCFSLKLKVSTLERKSQLVL